VRRAQLLIPILVTVALAACSSAQPSSLATSDPGVTTGASASPSPSDAESPGDQPSASGEPASEPPTASDAPASDEPTESATPEPTETPTSPPGIADACTGTDANREFFVSVGLAVDWPVLCAVLPSHWFVNTGSYRLANGGKLLISYKGPGGATIALSEGSFCSDGTGCVPAGADAGDAALGPLAGTLVRLNDGGFAIVVDRGANPSWLLVAHGIDEATTVSMGAALAEVGG
jgi:hypothetical protein